MNSWKDIIEIKYYLAIFSIIKLLKYNCNKLYGLHNIFYNMAKDKIKINPKAIIIGNPNTFVIA